MNKPAPIISSFLAGALCLLLLGAAGVNGLFRFNEWRVASPVAGQVVAFHDATTLTNYTLPGLNFSNLTRGLWQDFVERSVSGAEATIYSNIVPANTLNATGACIRFRFSGASTGTGGNKRFTVYYGTNMANAIQIFTTGDAAITAANWIEIDGYIMRTATGTQKTGTGVMVSEAQGYEAAQSANGGFHEGHVWGVWVRGFTDGGDGAVGYQWFGDFRPGAVW